MNVDNEITKDKIYRLEKDIELLNAQNLKQQLEIDDLKEKIKRHQSSISYLKNAVINLGWN